MIKVLHIVSNLSRRSGIMSCLINYNRMITPEECLFSYVYTDEREDSYVKEIQELGGKTYKISSPKNCIQFCLDYRKLGKEIYNEYDIAEIHDPFLISFMPNIKRAFGVKKLVTHAHSLRFSDTAKGELRNRVLSIPNRWIPDYYFACSIDAGRALFGNKFQKKGEVINNAINLLNFCPNIEDRTKSRNELQLQNEIAYGHVGNFVDPKNHMFLLDVFHEIISIQPNSVLILVGEGPLRERIEQRIADLNLNNKVRLLGARNDVAHIMRAMDCFIFPSKFEGLGISCIEAQAVGLPCIISDMVPQVANIVTNNNIVLSLNIDKTIWAKSAINQSRILPINVRNLITEKGFNIHVEAKKLVTKYRKLALK